MDYAPITYEKTISDFPSNKEFNLNNSAVIRTRLLGEDFMAISRLQQLKREDTETGEMVAALDGGSLLLAIMEKGIVSWTFKNRKTGEVYKITAKNIKKLLAEDFNYLSGEFKEILAQLNDENEEEGEDEDDMILELAAAPHKHVTEEEKNESASGSDDAS